MLKLKRFDVGVWFDWPKAPNVRLKIKPLYGKKLLELRNESKQGKVAVEMPIPDLENPKRNKIEIVDDYNDLTYEWKMFLYCLEDWEGITLEGDIEPKKEEILEAIFNNVEMRRFIISKAFEVMVSENRKLEEELKNLQGSQDG